MSVPTNDATGSVPVAVSQTPELDEGVGDTFV